MERKAENKGKRRRRKEGRKGGGKQKMTGLKRKIDRKGKKGK